MKKILVFLMMCVFAVSTFAQDNYLKPVSHVYTFISGHAGTLVDKPYSSFTGTVIGGSVTIGYQFSHMVNIGIGFAPAYTEAWIKVEKPSMHIGDNGSILPIFAQFRIDDISKKISPYAELRAGGIIGECKLGDIIYDKPSAAYLHGGLGVRIKRFNIGLSYTEEINKDDHAGYFGGSIGFVI